MNDGLLVTGMTKHFDTEIIWIEKLSSTDIEENTENKYSIKINKFKINFYKKLSNFEIYDTM